MHVLEQEQDRRLPRGPRQAMRPPPRTAGFAGGRAPRSSSARRCARSARAARTSRPRDRSATPPRRAAAARARQELRISSAQRLSGAAPPRSSAAARRVSPPEPCAGAQLAREPRLADPGLAAEHGGRAGPGADGPRSAPVGELPSRPTASAPGRRRDDTGERVRRRRPRAAARPARASYAEGATPSSRRRRSASPR